MSRLSKLDNDRLPEDLRKGVDGAETQTTLLTALRVIGYRPERITCCFEFQFPSDSRGIANSAFRKSARPRITELSQFPT